MNERYLYQIYENKIEKLYDRILAHQPHMHANRIWSDSPSWPIKNIWSNYNIKLQYGRSSGRAI